MTNPVSAAVPQRVVAAVANAAQRTGVSFEYLMDQARLESGLRPDARASTSSAMGLYQFTEQTWLGTVKQHGAAHGLDWAASAISQQSNGRFDVGDAALRRTILDMRANPEAAAAMAAEFAADNGEHLQSRLGGVTEAVDLYLAHFLGAKGAADFLSQLEENPQQAAALLFAEAARANRSIFYRKNGEPRSLAEIRDNFAAKLDAESYQQSATSARLASSSVRESKAPLRLGQIEAMPQRLDLDFARKAYSRLAGGSA